MFYRIAYSLLLSCCVLLAANQPVTVIVPSYNNASCCVKNLASIINQEYRPLHIIYIDDCSTDGTGDVIQRYIEHKNLSHIVTLIRNSYNRKAMANIYMAAHMCSDDQLITVVDGDDALAHTRVISAIVREQQKHDAWISYAQYKNVPESKAKALNMSVNGCAQAMPHEVVAQSAQRKHPWCWSGLRSFYAWIFKQIKLNDLLDTRSPHLNKFYGVCCDNAYFFPLLEMAGTHALFIPEILLLRNVDTPLNDFKVHKHEQRLTAMHIRSMKPYPRIAQPIYPAHNHSVCALLIQHTAKNVTTSLDALSSIGVSSVVILTGDSDTLPLNGESYSFDSIKQVHISDLPQLAISESHVLLIDGELDRTLNMSQAVQLLTTTGAQAYYFDIRPDLFGSGPLQSLPIEPCSPESFAFRFNSAPITQYLNSAPHVLVMPATELTPILRASHSFEDLITQCNNKMMQPTSLCLAHL